MRRVILEPGEQFDNSHLQRKSAFNAKAMQIATEIVEDVRQRGDECLRELTAKFDGVDLEDLRVPQSVLDAAPQQVDAEFLDAPAGAVCQIGDELPLPGAVCVCPVKE